ncbi:MAG: phytanoyl-CoA dioxygenase family protein [Pseudomonadales bacterium]|nr:phytanoyl-CoA dioxygenase family protein [Pseudomonadales bacterium]
MRQEKKPIEYLDVSHDELDVPGARAMILHRAVGAMRRDGIVCLKHAIPNGLVAALNTKMQADLDSVQVDRTPNSWISLRPPPFDPYLSREIVYNELAVEICLELLGTGSTLTTYGANTSWPGQGTPQSTHRDVPDAPVGSSPPGVVINIPLTTFTTENGATQIYPGSHETSVEDAQGTRQYTPKMLEEQANRRPPLQLTGVESGDLVIRDLRLWHGGMPNKTSERRIMLALVVIDADYRGGDESGFKGFEAEQGSEAFWQDSRMNTAVCFVPAGDRSYYLLGKHSEPLTALRKDWFARGKKPTPRSKD